MIGTIISCDTTKSSYPNTRKGTQTNSLKDRANAELAVWGFGFRGPASKLDFLLGCNTKGLLYRVRV